MEWHIEQERLNQPSLLDISKPQGVVYKEMLKVIKHPEGLR